MSSAATKKNTRPDTIRRNMQIATDIAKQASIVSLGAIPADLEFMERLSSLQSMGNVAQNERTGKWRLVRK